MGTRSLVMLDANAARDLFYRKHDGPWRARVAEALRVAIEQGTLDVVSTNSVVLELASMPDEHAADRACTLEGLRSLTRCRVLHPRARRLRDELRNGGRVPLAASLFSPEESAKVFQSALDEPGVAAALRALAEAGMRAHDDEARARATAAIQGTDRDDLVDESQQLAAMTLVATEDLAAAAASEGLPAPTSPPNAYPVFWYPKLLHSTRVPQLLLEPERSTKTISAYDSEHLADAAAHADVFVTGDRKLRTFAGCVRGLPVRVLDLDAWATEVLA